MSHIFNSLYPVFLCILLAGTIIPLLAFLAERFLLRESSASTRHRLWALAALGMLAFPVIVAAFGERSTIAESEQTAIAVPEEKLTEFEEIPAFSHDNPQPEIRIEQNPHTPEHSPPTAAPEPAFRPEITTHDRDFSDNQDEATAIPENQSLPEENRAEKKSFLLFYATAIWLCGVVVFVANFVFTQLKAGLFVFRIRFAKRNCGEKLLCQKKIDGIRVVFSDLVEIPFAFGIFSPVIVFPLAAQNWTEAKFHSVLLHERAHLVRRDLVWRYLVAICSAVYWPHPFVWLLARRVRVEQELACDDMVIRSGSKCSEYAYVLLELSKSISARNSIPEGVLAMVRKKPLSNELSRSSTKKHRVGRSAVGRQSEYCSDCCLFRSRWPFSLRESRFRRLLPSRKFQSK